jgi:hypothetical protein
MVKIIIDLYTITMTSPQCQNSLNNTKQDILKQIHDKNYSPDQGYAYCEKNYDTYSSEGGCSIKDVDNFCSDVTRGGRIYCPQAFDNARSHITNLIKDNKITKDDAYKYCRNTDDVKTMLELDICTQTDVDSYCKDFDGGGSSSMWIWILIVVLVILAVGVGFYVVEKKKKRGGGRYAAVPAMPNSINGW